MLEEELGEEAETPTPRRNLELLIEYSGAPFAGWQVQPDQRTAMGEIERAIAEITREEVRVVAASRTDAGVHALGQVSSFHSSSQLPCKKLWSGLNAVLPDGIAVKRVREVPPDFHARFSARGKHYRYRILDRRTPSPLEAGTSWHVKVPLDLGAMRKAAGYLVGEHCFRAFATQPEEGDTCVRTLHAVQIGRTPSASVHRGLLTVDVVGSSFLYKMVRTLVGTLVRVGKGKRTPESIRDALTADNPKKAGPTAPAQGLFLMSVFYSEDELFDSTPLRGSLEGEARESHHHGPQHAGPRQREGIRGAEGQEARALL